MTAQRPQPGAIDARNETDCVQASEAPLDHPTTADLERHRREQLYDRFSWWTGDAD